MKKLILFLIVIFGINSMEAQEVIQLDEARLNFSPSTIIVDSKLGTVKCIVKEEYTGEFSANPIRFMKEKFDFKEFLSVVSNNHEFDEYLVTFNSSKGFLKAIYTAEGELVKTTQLFKNINLPPAIRNELFINNEGWVVTSNKYSASGKADKIDKEFYRIKLTNGNKKRIIKITPSSTLVSVAHN